MPTLSRCSKCLGHHEENEPCPADHGFGTAFAEPPIQIFICPPKCDAGGKPEHDGHLFNIPYDEDLESGYKCKCGLTNVSWDMRHGP